MKLRTAAAVCVVLVALAGCGGSSEDDAAGTPAAEPSAAATQEAAASVDLASTTLGDVLVGPDGRTLYMFDPDKQGASTCYDQCATAWPPLTVEGDPAAGEGLDASLVGTTERTDGTVQVTYDGWPLYYWAKDTKAGDVTGQAVNDVWWVLDAAGAPVRTPAS